MLDEAHSPAVGSLIQDTVEAGSLVQLRIAPGRMICRIGPAWAVLAGAVAVGVPLSAADVLLRLAAAVVLADLLWGVLRRVIPDRPSPDGTTVRRLPSVPYGHPDAPLTRFLQAVGTGEQAAAVPWLGWVSGLVFALALSLLLGVYALALTFLAVAVMLLARALALRGSRPALCLALLDVALPGLLGAMLVWPKAGAGPWLGLALAFTLLQWGWHRARLSAGLRPVGVWVGQVAVLAMLILLQQPAACVVCALLFAPPMWWLARRLEVGVALLRGLPWWWAALLLTAWVVR